MALAQPGTFEACFRTPAFPAISPGATKRNTCQNGKFHGITARTTPSGWKVTKLLPPKSTGSVQKIFLRVVGEASRSGRREFSTSARPSVSVFPISSVINRANSLFARAKGLEAALWMARRGQQS